MEIIKAFDNSKKRLFYKVLSVCVYSCFHKCTSPLVSKYKNYHNEQMACLFMMVSI